MNIGRSVSRIMKNRNASFNRKMQLSGTTQDDLFLRRRRRRVIQLQPKKKPKLPKR